MKRVSPLIVVLCIAFILASLPVFAGIVFSSQCLTRGCVEGTLVNFSVRIRNNLNHSVTIADVFIKDTKEDKVLGLDIRDDVNLSPKEKFDFSFPTKIQMPPKGYTWYYTSCFTASVENISKIICSDAPKSFTVTPLSTVQCYNTTQCNAGQLCKFYKCVSQSSLEPIDWLFYSKVSLVVLAILLLCFLFLKRKS